MKNKILLFLCISMFSISAIAQDKTHSWNPGENPNTTYKWTEAANWFIHDGSQGYPNDIEAANAEIGNGLYPAVGEVIVDDSVNVFNIKVGNGGDGEAVLRIQKGGYVHTGKWWSGIAWTSPGKLIVEKGGTMTFGEHFWIGWNADGVAIIEGTVNVTAMYGGGAFGGHAGISNTFIKNGGVLNLSQLNPDKSFTEGSFIDIGGGTLNFKATAENYEDVIVILQAFIDAGNIISYEGNGELTLTWVEEEGVVRVTAASVVYQVDLSEVTDQKEGGKVWVMLGDSDYEEMTDENGDGIYLTSVTADRAMDLTYWFEYENAGGSRTIEDMTGKECASGNKRAIEAAPENSVLVLLPVLFNSCDVAAEKVQQATTEWAGSKSGLWSVAENWSDGFVPNDNKVVFKNPAAPECILNVESTIKQFVLGDGGEASTLKVIAGGTLTTTSGWSGIGWTAPASMVVEQGGTVNFAEHAWIGWESDATLTLDGGTINVAGMYGTAFEGGAGTAMVTIKRGVLNLAQLHDTKSIPEGSKLDITAGMVKIAGDKVAIVNAYAEAGRLTGYAGQGSISAVLVGDSTIVTAIPARQATTVWNPAGNPESTGLWSEAANWTDSNTPLDNKVVFNVPGATECVLDVESTIKQFVLGDGDVGGTLRITEGGTLTTTSGWSGVAWTHDATLIVETGGTINFAEHAWIGWIGNATLMINGGTINVAGMYGTAFEGQAGKGMVTINSGTLNLTGFDPAKSIPDGSYMNIKEGTVTIQGDKTVAVNDYATAGKITAYGGNGDLNVVFADGVTTVTATAVRKGTTVWNPATNPASTGLWSEAANWTDGMVPEDNKVVTNVPGAAVAVLDTESTIKQFVLGDGGEGGTVRIANGGILTTTSGWSGIGWTADAKMIVDAGGTVNFAEHAWIGWDGNGTLEINGGTVNVAGMYGTAFEGQAGTGTVKVKKGALNLAQIHPDKSIPEGSIMDIELGVVKINGDQTVVVNAYAAAGKITAFAGTGTLEVSFADDVTTVYAIPAKGATTVWDPSTNPGTSNGLWSDALNWTDRHAPGDNKVVFKTTNAPEAVLDVESTIKQLVLGDGGASMQTLRITNGGTLSTTSGWSGIGWNTPATLIVETGGVFNFGSHAWIGWKGNATVQINGGTINVAGMYGTAFEGNPGGKADMHVNSGQLNLQQIHPEKSIPEGSVLDITEGKVTIVGDQLAVVQTYIDLGRITAYGGSGRLFVSFDGTITTIDAKDWATSAEDMDEQFTSRVYPNPTKGLITIENPANGDFSYSIYSLTGKLVLTKNNNSGPSVQVDMSGLVKGIYMFNVRSAEKTVMHKVIFQ